MDSLRDRLRIEHSHLDAINRLLTDPNNEAISALLDVVAKYGTPDEINHKAEESRRLDNLMSRLAQLDTPYLDDVIWLIGQAEAQRFISVDQYRRKVLGDKVEGMVFDDAHAVTLEISAAQYFPWLREQAERAIANGELMPARYIRVRKMKEQEADHGDTLAFAAAMQIMDTSYVETLDTKGTDGSNVHLGGPGTITGYFGGVGMPNDHALKWVDEMLYYYTTYGVKQVLNVNPGTVFLGYMLHRLGIDFEFKISVFMGNDNPFAALWTLIGAKLFAREDGSSPLAGFNWSNSVNNQTLETSAYLRQELGFEDVVRFEHHIVETWRSIVRQPYDRLDDLVAIAPKVKNISAKHEGGTPEVERQIEAAGGHTSDLLDYFRDKDEILASGDWDALQANYINKHLAVNRTAEALTRAGLSFIAAPHLHHRKE